MEIKRRFFFLNETSSLNNFYAIALSLHRTKKLCPGFSCVFVSIATIEEINYLDKCEKRRCV